MLISPLHIAVFMESIEITKKLVDNSDEFSIDINAKQKGFIIKDVYTVYLFVLNWTPLHIACAHNNLNIVEILLSDKKIDVNVENNDFI